MKYGNVDGGFFPLVHHTRTIFLRVDHGQRYYDEQVLRLATVSRASHLRDSTKHIQGNKRDASVSGTEERRTGSLEIRDFDKFAENNKKNIIFFKKKILKFVFKRIRSKRK